MPWTHYFYDPVYVSYTNTNTAPKVSSQISVFLVNLYIGHDSRCMYMLLKNIQLITCIYALQHISLTCLHHMSVIIYPQVDMLRFHVSIWGTPPKAHSMTSERHVSTMRVPTHPMKFMMKCMPPNRKTKFWNRSGFAHVMFTGTW